MAKPSDVRAKQSEFLFPCVAKYYQEPVVLTRAEGSRVSDLDGREYLDFFGGILTIGIGHCHPEVTEAVSRQMRTLGHTSTLYPTEGQVRVAEKLARLTPGKLKKSFFTNSGSEADETAVVLAKIFTGRQEIVALRHGYSGRTHLAMGLNGLASWRLIPNPIAGIVHAAAPYCYRCPYGLTYPNCGVRCAQDLEEVIQTQTATGKPAAFVAEPIQGVGGFITPPPEYFQIAVGIVRKYGGLFICDEVQTGFGRTGGKWFGIEHYGVEPDIMTMAKAIANGFPVGATIATEEVANAWTGATISTFGGNSVAMAAVDATLSVMEREDAPRRAEERGRELRERLEQYKETYPFVGDVRGMGLMQAIELVEDKKSKAPSPGKTAALMEAAKKHGLLFGKGGLHGNTIRIAPPILIGKDEMAEGLRRFDAAMAEVK
ncbi:MAG TPA: aspartate aminotransferase family protein [Candidatus Acidoferrum sp.]|nr:aspartate aminotransferase family protein [Candidatus Acidoferrum sp.]